jgi:hypothetical protein
MGMGIDSISVCELRSGGGFLVQNEQIPVVLCRDKGQPQISQRSIFARLPFPVLDLDHFLG